VRNTVIAQAFLFWHKESESGSSLFSVTHKFLKIFAEAIDKA
jgi:hypothetical protein